MGKDYTRTNIRLQKVFRRLCKTVYPTCPLEKRVIKNTERAEMLGRYIDSIWLDMHRKGFRPSIDNSNPLFFEDFDKLNAELKKVARLHISTQKAIAKSGRTEDEIRHDQMRRNIRLNRSF